MGVRQEAQQLNQASGGNTTQIFKSKHYDEYTSSKSQQSVVDGQSLSAKVFPFQNKLEEQADKEVYQDKDVVMSQNSCSSRSPWDENWLKNVLHQRNQLNGILVNMRSQIPSDERMTNPDALVEMIKSSNHEATEEEISKISEIAL